MSYLVLARKCRPGRFSEVVGQSHVTRTLANAIKMDRVAHGFLFSGVRGVGKTSLARILAKSLNCAGGPTDEPCGVCDSCRAIAAGTAVDVIEIDGASNNSVDDIRELRETVPYRPVLGRFKIYVIDEVHMLSVSAFNALLKTLEEPPPHVKFIFATTEPHKIPMTILSRVQRYDFRRILSAAIADRIKEILVSEGIEAEDGAIAIVSREAEGSMRDALSILDQVLAAGERRITAEFVAALLGVVSRKVYYDLSGAVLSRNPRACLEIIRDVDRQGFDITTFVRGFLEHLRNLMVAAVCSDDLTLLDLPREEIDDLVRLVGFDDAGNPAPPFQARQRGVRRHCALAVSEDSARGHAGPDVRYGRSGPGGADSQAPRSPGAFRHRRCVVCGRGRRWPSVLSPGTETVAPVGKRPESAQSAQPSQPVQPVQPSQPVQPAQPSQPVSGEPLTEAMWKSLLEELTRTIPAKSSIIERAVPSAESTTARICLQYDPSDSFNASRASETAVKAEVEAAWSRRLGHPVSYSVVTKDLGRQSSVARERLAIQEKQEAARQHPVVRGLEQALNGKVTRVQVKN